MRSALYLLIRRQFHFTKYAKRRVLPLRPTAFFCNSVFENKIISDLSEYTVAIFV